MTTRARGARIYGTTSDGQLRVWVSAPAVEGAANDAVVRLVSAELGIRRNAVTSERGATSRLKLMAVHGVTTAELLARWAGPRVQSERSGGIDAARR